MTTSDELPIKSNSDVVLVRQHVRTAAVNVGLSLVDQTKVVTAASELARNALVYAGGGQVRIEIVNNGIRKGLRLAFSDTGPGIPDIPQALTDGWTTGGGLGLGLSGSRRLVDEFDLQSAPGEGTLITVTKWAR
ncbi:MULTISPECIES: anti-sigma regulatory factor [Streptosporangium]|uniref:Anti-sigma regulatory factor, serine/threonine protein kinase n=1 Tax=Streptosporangium roseum (strain ATCC 12428 / DSM 43021 / JCM 3005 / KCTC 9067 / NCIMB 10171 / NRRL 2505 / NI 9100) TaxID=479432 RepID=D2AZK4_STRRD|nr:anti-sigma regulatory factor [Streptosporangium roseum]ACZ85249.1 putative anti-sigma regulatory factor, serine/threonine protein kinase [Streptosporangium roseum DSM 43021]